MAEETKRTIIENGTEIDGAIKSERSIVLSGSVKGQITAPSLEVTQDGKVSGTIKVSKFSCKGEVGGEVFAEAVELSGRVCDSTVIRSKTLDVKLAQNEGAVEFSERASTRPRASRASRCRASRRGPGRGIRRS